jgi:7-alpha-hydroxysteroid dehydrogenase
VLGQPPAVAEGVGGLPVAVAPELVLQRVQHHGGCVHGTLPEDLHVLGIEMQHGGGATDGLGRKHAHLGELVGHHHRRVAEPQLDRHELSPYAQAGADIVLVARTRPQLDAVAARIRASGRKAITVAGDVRDLTQAPIIVEQAVAELGRLDVVVNNAGGAEPRALLDTTGAELDAAFHLNVTAAFELVKQATPQLLAGGHGSVVNISSTMDRMVGRGLLVYGTVKAALSHMTRLLAADLAPRVRVNAIAPGVVETDGLKAALTDELRAQVTAATPLHRLASVDDIASAAVWLASPAAGYVTGKVIGVDGGAQAPAFPNEIPDL